MSTKIDFFGKSDLLYLCQLLSTELTKYVKAVEGKGLSTHDLTDALYNKLNNLDLSAYAPLASPALTGTPTAPTAATSTNDTQIATTAFTKAAIADAIKDISGVKFDGPYASYDDMVERVTDPREGTIYLVTNSGSAPNANDEYFYRATTKTFELFGTTAVDLSGYVKSEDIGELASTEVKAVWDSVFTTSTT